MLVGQVQSDVLMVFDALSRDLAMLVRSRISATIILCSLVVTVPAYGQSDGDHAEAVRELLESLQPKTWSYSELEKAADVVMIATLRSQKSGAVASGGSVIVTSTVDIAAVLKGSLKEETCEVVHLRRADGVLDLSNKRYPRIEKTLRVPEYATVVVDGKESFSNSIGTREITPEYLIFLKRRSDGRFTLVSGDDDGASSVRMLSRGVAEHVAK